VSAEHCFRNHDGCEGHGDCRCNCFECRQIRTEEDAEADRNAERGRAELDAKERTRRLQAATAARYERMLHPPPEPERESFLLRFSPTDREASFSLSGIFRPTSIGSNVEGFGGAQLVSLKVGAREQLVGKIPLGALHAHGTGFPYALRDLWKLSGVESGLRLDLPTLPSGAVLSLACEGIEREVELYLDGWFLPNEAR
jgi:hypothetical protein